MHYAFGQSESKKVENYHAKYADGNTISEKAWLISLSGDTVPLTDFKGKWLFIDYWSVTCAPCLKELPAVQEFASQMTQQDFEVIAVSMDTKMDKWEKFSVRRKLTIPSYFAGRSPDNDIFGLNLSLLIGDSETQLTTTLPRYSLISPDGVIMRRSIELKPSDPKFKDYIESLIE